MTPLVAVLAVLATYRATLLVTADKLTEPPRDWLVDRLETIAHRREECTEQSNGEWSFWRCSCGEAWTAGGFDASGRAAWQIHAETAPRRRESKLAYLIQCPWCASWWVALAVVGTALVWGDQTWWQLGAGTLAASGVTGILASVASPDD